MSLKSTLSKDDIEYIRPLIEIASNYIMAFFEQGGTPDDLNYAGINHMLEKLFKQHHASGTQRLAIAAIMHWHVIGFIQHMNTTQEVQS
jgi:hypothetical protein